MLPYIPSSQSKGAASAVDEPTVPQGDEPDKANVTWLLFALPEFSNDKAPFMEVRDRAGQKDSALSQKAYEDIVQLSRQQPSKNVPAQLSSLTKGVTWFDALMMLHFAGHPVDECSDEELGLTVCGTWDENIVFSEVIKKLHKYQGSRTPESFLLFINEVVLMDFVGQYCDRTLISILPGWFKSMRAELVHLAKTGDAQGRIPFDARYSDFSGAESVYAHETRHLRLKFRILESLLYNAPAATSLYTLDHWLHGENHQIIRSTLFAQNDFPLNVDFDHHALWTLVISRAAHSLPDPEFDSLYRVFDQTDGSGLVLDSFKGKTLGHEIEGSFGRTLILASENGCLRYLKIQSRHESRQQFLQATERVRLLKRWQDQGHLPLCSEMVEIGRVIQIDNVEGLVSGCVNRSEILGLTGKAPRLAVEFTTSSHAPYHTYIYDLHWKEEQKRALLCYLRDYGILWKKGICGPGSINAFHCVDQHRDHMTFPNLKSPEFLMEGSVESWNGCATDYPNVGKVGMRDPWDAHLPHEKSFSSTHYNSTDDTRATSQKKHRILELAHAAEGAVLIYARCCNHEFDVADPGTVQSVAEDVSQFMIELFTRAFPITKERCQSLMEEDDLIHQCAREVCYWLAVLESDGFYYVDDLRKAKINRDAYPHLPQNMQGCVLRENQARFLKDCGFHSDRRDPPGVCQLGSGSGRTPLLALNAMLAKLISSGVICAVHQQERNSRVERRRMVEKGCVIV